MSWTGDPNQYPPGLLQPTVTVTGMTTTPSYYGTLPSPTPPYENPLGKPSYIPDHRDQEIQSLRNALHEAYAEIGRLHEQVRGITNFREWTEREMAKQETSGKP